MSQVYKFQLARDFHYLSGHTPTKPITGRANFSVNGKTWLQITPQGGITVKAGYCWDGCSPKLKCLDLFLVGTPDGILNVNSGKPKTYYASLVHDVLYQFMDDPAMPFTRRQADLIFLQLLREADFKPAPVYYAAVRLFGRLRERWGQQA